MVYGDVELTWEWREDYRLRSALHPTYFAFPLWILKQLGLDYGFAVRSSPKIAHILLVII